MSKTLRKQRRKPVPWLLILMGGILLIAAAAFIVNRSGDGGGTPIITVEQSVIDYGDVRFDTPMTFAIRVTNTGDGALRFEEQPYIEVVEGC
ncbi:MAG: DUF1573 domain-containing protein [Chloroflexi bacterium]|nr:DUF1573 domain-containing protein [Chloroflexota bacterium]